MAVTIDEFLESGACPVVFKGFGIMAVQLHRREISLKNARVTLEVMSIPDDDLRRQITCALEASKTKKQLAKKLEDIQDYIIASGSGSGSDDFDDCC